MDTINFLSPLAFEILLPVRLVVLAIINAKMVSSCHLARNNWQNAYFRYFHRSVIFRHIRHQFCEISPFLFHFHANQKSVLGNCCHGAIIHFQVENFPSVSDGSGNFLGIVTRMDGQTIFLLFIFLCQCNFCQLSIHSFKLNEIPRTTFSFHDWERILL